MNTTQEILSVLRELLSLTREQSRVIESSGMEGMDENLAAREQCLQKLSGFSGRDPDAAGAAEIRALVAEIRAIEKSNADSLKSSMTHIEGQMKKANEGKVAMQAYDGFGSDLGSSFNKTK